MSRRRRNHQYTFSFPSSSDAPEGDVPVSRIIGTQPNSGLAGGGDLTADRQLRVDPNAAAALGGTPEGTDLLLVYDESALALRRVTYNELVPTQALSDLSDADTTGVSAGQVLVYGGATWTPGRRYADLHTVEGIPTGGTGLDGDFAIDTTTGVAYQKASGAWSALSVRIPILPDWQASTVYPVGARVVADDADDGDQAKIWQATTAHTSGATWDPTNWEILSEQNDAVEVLAHAKFTIAGSASGVTAPFDTTVLNTRTDKVALAANQVVLQPGRYQLSARATKTTAAVIDLELANITTGAIEGLVRADGYSTPGVNVVVDISVPTTYALREQGGPSINNWDNQSVTASRPYFIVAELASDTAVGNLGTATAVTVDTATGYLDIGSYRRAWGITPGSAAVETVTFPAGGFASAPTVVFTVEDSAIRETAINSRTATQAVLEAGAARAKHWMAEGQKP